MQTNIGVNSPQAVARWSTALAVDFARQLYFAKFCGESENSMIHQMVDLESGAGDRVAFDLSMRLTKRPIIGDNIALGNEENLKFLQDEVRIDQMRKPASTGGRMTKKRTIHNLRSVAKSRTAEYCAEWLDEVFSVYLAGDVGFRAINEDQLVGGPDEQYVGVVNPLEAPDNDHILFAGEARSTADLTADDKMGRKVIERAVAKTKMMNATNPNVTQMKPSRVDGAERFVMVMNPWQVFDLRNEEGNAGWLEIQKHGNAKSSSNPIFTDQLGMIGNVVLHEHTGVRRFNDYGAGGNVEAARALLLGRQAGTAAYGAGGDGQKSRMFWREELTDYGNNLSILAGMIVGVKKTRYQAEGRNASTDFGVLAVDTAAADPNKAAA